MNVGEVLGKKFPQLLGEIELLKQEDDWVSILSEKLSKVKEDLAFFELLSKLGWTNYEMQQSAIADLIAYENPSDYPTRITVPANSITPRPIQWRVKDFLKSNSLTVLAGDPSAGKSFLSTYIGACISAGKPLFGVEVPVGKVLYFSNEDVLEDTVVPRLINQGADLNHIRLMELSTELVLPEDAKKIAYEIACERPDVVIIDVINNFLGEKTDTHNDKSLRKALRPLVYLAQHYNCSIIALTHLNKGKSSNPIYRLNGSVGYSGGSRMVWYLGNNKDNKKRILSVIKSNAGEEGLNCEFDFELPSEENGHPTLVYRGRTEEFAPDILNLPQGEMDEVTQCAMDIVMTLEELPNKTMGSKELKTRIMNNYTYKQFTDAKKMCDELEVFQKGGKWYTKLVTLNSEGEEEE